MIKAGSSRAATQNGQLSDLDRLADRLQHVNFGNQQAYKEIEMQATRQEMQFVRQEMQFIRQEMQVMRQEMQAMQQAMQQRPANV